MPPFLSFGEQHRIIILVLIFCILRYQFYQHNYSTITILTTIIFVDAPLTLPMTTNRMIQSWWLNTVAGGSATRSGGSRLTSTITTNSMIQSRRGRTVRGFLAFSSGLSRHRGRRHGRPVRAVLLCKDGVGLRTTIVCFFVETLGDGNIGSPGFT